MTSQLNSLLAFVVFAFLIMASAYKEGHPKEEKSRKALVEQVARDYFATFAERKDWDKLCAFYREDMIFEDVMLQLKLDSLWQFKRFYKWDEEGGHFKKLSPDQDHITIETLVVNDTVAVGKGSVNPFYYYDEYIDPEWGMAAAFWLYFDENLKIKKQVDWIEYDPEVLESVIKRVREKGVDKIPDWLDLSKE